MSQLLTTIAEFRAGLPVSVNTDIEPLIAALDAGERKLLVPVLGRAQYRDLVVAYQGKNLRPEQAELLKLLQTALANLAYAPYITLAQLQIDNQGIRVVYDGTSRTASQWQIDDLREYLTETGYAALDDALEFLDEHKTAFPLWAQSAAYTANKGLLLNNAADFQRYYNIGSSRRTFLALLPIIGREEVFSLEPALSAPFCAALRAEIQTGTVSADTQAVLRLLHPALANFTVAEALTELSVDVSASGLVVKELAVGGDNNRTKRQASDVLLAQKREQALANGRTYLGSLLSFLNRTASATVYPDFFASDRYVAPVTPTTTAAPGPRRRIYGAC